MSTNLGHSKPTRPWRWQRGEPWWPCLRMAAKSTSTPGGSKGSSAMSWGDGWQGRNLQESFAWVEMLIFFSRIPPNLWMVLYMIFTGIFKWPISFLQNLSKPMATVRSLNGSSPYIFQAKPTATVRPQSWLQFGISSRSHGAIPKMMRMHMLWQHWVHQPPLTHC